MGLRRYFWEGVKNSPSEGVKLFNALVTLFAIFVGSIPFLLYFFWDTFGPMIKRHPVSAVSLAIGVAATAAGLFLWRRWQKLHEQIWVPGNRSDFTRPYYSPRIQAVGKWLTSAGLLVIVGALFLASFSGGARARPDTGGAGSGPAEPPVPQQIAAGDGRLTILVADLDGPDEKYGLTGILASALTRATEGLADTKVVGLGEVIKLQQGPAVAREKGRQHGAFLVGCVS